VLLVVRLLLDEEGCVKRILPPQAPNEGPGAFYITPLNIFRARFSLILLRKINENRALKNIIRYPLFHYFYFYRFYP
jgi:hypothetical protein